MDTTNQHLTPDDSNIRDIKGLLAVQEANFEAFKVQSAEREASLANTVDRLGRAIDLLGSKIEQLEAKIAAAAQTDWNKIWTPVGLVGSLLGAMIGALFWFMTYSANASERLHEARADRITECVEHLAKRMDHLEDFERQTLIRFGNAVHP